MMQKRGSAEIRIFERVLEFLLPVLVFIIVMYAVYSSASDKTVFSYYQATELSNIVDAAASFDGTVRIKYHLIQDDFAVNISPTLLQVFLPKTKVPVGKQIHIPQGFYLESQLVRTKNMPIKQIQLIKSGKTLGFAAWTSADLDQAVFKKDQTLCRADPSDVAFKYSEVDPTKRPSNPDSKPLKVYVDDTGFEYPANTASDSTLPARISDVQLVKSEAESDLVIKIRSQAASFGSAVIMYAPNEKLAASVSCLLNNAISASDLKGTSQDTLTPVLIPLATAPNTARKPTIDIEVNYDANGEEKRYAYVNIISQAIATSAKVTP